MEVYLVWRSSASSLSGPRLEAIYFDRKKAERRRKKLQSDQEKLHLTDWYSIEEWEVVDELER